MLGFFLVGIWALGYKVVDDVRKYAETSSSSITRVTQRAGEPPKTEFGGWEILAAIGRYFPSLAFLLLQDPTASGLFARQLEAPSPPGGVLLSLPELMEVPGWIDGFFFTPDPTTGQDRAALAASLIERCLASLRHRREWAESVAVLTDSKEAGAVPMDLKDITARLGREPKEEFPTDAHIVALLCGNPKVPYFPYRCDAHCQPQPQPHCNAYCNPNPRRERIF